MGLPKPYFEDSSVVIYHADCRDILPLLPKVNLVLTDPPYGVGFRYETYVDNLEGWCGTVLPALLRCRELAPVNIVTMSMKRLWDMPRPDGILCWAHPGSTRHNTFGGFSEWEPVLVYGKRNIINDFRYLPDCTNHTPEATLHPCPKPLALFRWLVDIGSDDKTLILDPFMGSGTTLRAAKDLGRKAIGIEMEEKYCEIAAKRMSQSVMQL